jgi:hypothetical protein
MWPFRKRTEVSTASLADLFTIIRQQKNALSDLREEVQRLEAKVSSVSGRVYALWGKTPSIPEPQATGADAAPTRPETKEELRARLLPHGKRFKHDTN